jgi:predicted phosphodiesterase
MRTLVIGDVHEPVAHPGYLQFCRDLREQWKCDDVVFIGDIVDWHGISFHAKHPDAPGPKDEYELALAKVHLWEKVFPKARVCIGNHDARVVRIAEENGIPSKLIRDYNETWHTPGWDWRNEHTSDDVYYFHGVGCGGAYPAANAMRKMLMSVCIGHVHSAGGIKWAANPSRRIFGLDTGCGIDDRAYAFAYGEHLKVRSILSAAVILDGVPYHEIMPCGPGERYHRSRFKSDNKKEVKWRRRAWR